jgi:hypothetical protein
MVKALPDCSSPIKLFVTKSSIYLDRAQQALQNKTKKRVIKVTQKVAQ